MNRRSIIVPLFVLLTASAAAQCVVYPGVQSSPASDGCSGIWSNLIAPVVPTSIPGKSAYVPSSPDYISFVITETNKPDITINQTDVTMIVTPPMGWEFRSNPAQAAFVYCDNSGDINLPASNALVVTSGAITLTFSSNVNGNKLDWLYFLNIQVRPITGVINPPGPIRYAYRTGGTASMTGIVTNSTVFATLTLTPGSFAIGGNLAFTAQPASLDGTVCSDVSATVATVDCAGNPTTVGVPANLVVTAACSPVPSNTNFPRTVDVGTSAGNGYGTLTGYVRNPGSYFLNVTTASPYRALSSSTFPLVACPPSVLVWITQPIGAEMYNPLVQQPVLELRDTYGNPSYVSGTVTLALDYAMTTPYDPLSTLLGTLTLPIQPNARVSYTDLKVTSTALDLFRLLPTTSVSGVSTTPSQYFSFTAPLPVELVSFSARLRDGRVLLAWKTATESNNYGFDIERSAAGTEAYQTIGFMPGAGTTNTPRSYAFEDRPVPEAKVLQYRLKQIDRDGQLNYSPVVSVSLAGDAPPLAVSVLPTVITAAGTMRVTLAQDEVVSIDITNALGQKAMDVAVALPLGAGNHVLPFNAAGLQPGAWFVCCSSGSRSTIAKFVIAN